MDLDKKDGDTVDEDGYETSMSEGRAEDLITDEDYSDEEEVDEVDEEEEEEEEEGKCFDDSSSIVFSWA